MNDALPIARSLALKFPVPAGLVFQDLVDFAMGGAVEALGTFDPGRNVKFTTFARHRMHGALRDAIRDWTGQRVNRKSNRPPHISLDRNVNTSRGRGSDGDGEPLSSLIGYIDPRYDDVEAREFIERLLVHFTEEETAILEAAFGYSETHAEIALRMKMKEHQVRYRLAIALAKARRIAARLMKEDDL
jgi:RNA polymerase sigma factor (sigma-70 family)